MVFNVSHSVDVEEDFESVVTDITTATLVTLMNLNYNPGSTYPGRLATVHNRDHKGRPASVLPHGVGGD